MAEHPPSGPTELGAPMDYGQHEQTYARFLALTKITILATVSSILALAILSFGGPAGFWLGILLLILMLVGVAIGIFTNGSARALIVVTVIGVLLMAISVG